MIDPEKVYIAGHDLGGVLAPRIDLEADFAGMIMLGAPAHRWNYVAYDQLVRYGFNGVENETMRFLKPMIKGEYEELEKKETYTEDELTSVYLYQYGYFWRDLLSYDYPAMAASSGKPVLVILGKDDYQIPAEGEVELWENALAASSAPHEVVVVEGINHMMLKMDGLFTDVLKQYERPLRVDQKVIDEIAELVLQQK